MNCLTICLTGGAVLMFAQLAGSKPLDRRAHDVLEIAKAVATDTNKRGLSPTELQQVLEATRTDSTIVRMAAAYALAFTDSSSGKKALAGLAASKDDEVAGVADFSVLRKQTSHLIGQELLSVLSFRLGRSQRPWTRALLVSWLADQFKGATTRLFIEALETENDSLVRAELLFQIACYGSRDQLATVKALLDRGHGELDGSFDESEFFLDRVSMGPIQRPPLSLKQFLISRMRTNNQ